MTEICQSLPDGLTLRASDSATSPVLERFFQGYDRAFVLPDEREELSGFETCLALNGSELARAFGRRHVEIVLTLDNDAGALLGGANFLSTRMSDGQRGTPPISVSLNYVFVERAARGRGLLRVLVRAVSQLANEVHGLTGVSAAPAIFIEQNDPLRLTSEDYAADTERSGMDPFERLSIWARLGARMVDFPYVQPALSKDKAPDEGLIYTALAYPGDQVPPWFFHDHLQSFFGVSVLKGAALERDAIATRQLSELKTQTPPIRLRSFRAALDALKLAPVRPRATNFLDFVRQRDP